MEPDAAIGPIPTIRAVCPVLLLLLLLYWGFTHNNIPGLTSLCNIIRVPGPDRRRSILSRPTSCPEVQYDITQLTSLQTQGEERSDT